MSNPYHGKFQATLSELERSRLFFQDVLTAWQAICTVPIDQELLLVGFSEAFVNVVKHSYCEEVDRPLEVQCWCRPDRLDVVLTHAGCSFRPPPGEPRPPDGLVENGMGLFLMSAAFDEVTYCSLNGPEQCIRLSKRSLGGDSDRESG